MKAPLGCAVPGCQVLPEPNRLMCDRHWRLVPAVLQRDVEKHDRDRAEGVPLATLRWTMAALAAKNHAAYAECCEEVPHAAAR